MSLLAALHVSEPRALLLLLGLPLFLLTAGGARTAAALRTLAAAVVVLLVAGLHVETTAPAAGTCIVVAIDASASVQRAAAARARSFVEALVPRLRDDDVAGAMLFAARPHVVARPSARPRADALVPDPDPTAADAADTDVAAALVQAAALCPAARQASVLLVTDGNETSGSMIAEAGLADPPVPVFPLLPAAEALPPVVVRRLLAPAFAPAGSVLPLEAVIENRSGRPLSAAVRMTAHGGPPDDEADPRRTRLELVDVPPGVSVAPLPWRAASAGQYLVEATLLLAPDLPPAPAPGQASVAVARPLRVLVVSEREAPVVAAALAERGAEVERVPPPALAGRIGTLAATHLVVLDDVGHDALAAETLAALADRVEAGGALVVTGGPHLFGDAGLLGSPLERILPVELQSQVPEPREREPIALYLLIDRSNSMGYASAHGVGYGDKMAYAKRAALAVLEQLGDEDLVGAVAFDSQAYPLGALAPVRESREGLTARIQQLQYGGGTDFKDALDVALQQLAASPRRVRHVILLTDGDTNRRGADHADLIAALAHVDISVTTIRIGSDTGNLELLHTMARATGGQFHHAERVDVLPQLLISDTRRQIDLAAGREGLPVRVGEPGPMLAGLTERELPPVARWAVTRLRPGAELRLYVDTSERRDPILATWQHGLGRAVAIPLDFQAGAAAWAAWPGFAKLWAQLAAWAAPPGLPGDRRLAATRTPAGARVELETLAAEDGPFALAVEGGDPVLLRPTRPRHWEALLPPLAPGVHAATLHAAGTPVATSLVVPAFTPSGRELRAGEPDRARLARLAALTGGRLEPTPGDLLAARPGTTRHRVPLDPWLVPLALVLVLADIATRDLVPDRRGS